MPDVVIRRGIPSMPSISRDIHPGQYPYETIEVVKLLREQGLTVEFEDDRSDREYFTHDAFDIWIPVMAFIGGISVNVLTEVFKQVITRGQESKKNEHAVLHVEISVERPDGSRQELKIDGSPEVVFKALEQLCPESGNDGDGQLPRA